jgi:cobalamin biosynthetic protein CobC
MTLFHGGDIQSASEQFDIPLDQWIDLSTGISSFAYPVKKLLGTIDPSVFERLPYLQKEFLINAAQYYGNSSLLAVPGTQSAIGLLPACLASYTSHFTRTDTSSFPILLPNIGYQEHKTAWEKLSKESGSEESASTCAYYDAFDLRQATSLIDLSLQKNPRQHLLVINPNNPTGQQFSLKQLQSWASRLAGGGHLIVDEAFIDTQAENSILSLPLAKNVVVYRSFGKFFGLAGMRVGFVFANQKLLNILQEKIGLWAINGPAQNIVTQACVDRQWQQTARAEIHKASALSQTLFAALFANLKVTATHLDSLFSSYCLDESLAEKLLHFFASQGVLLRKIPLQNGEAILRIGSVHPQQQAKVELLKKIIDRAERIFDKEDCDNDLLEVHPRIENA